ncbi:siderophore-interacting protein [Pseudarthrobacter chlorophenolicus]|uniref:siderophore-interacting protein n=1 Tax=Pseudarthrobacter chlorophenolicus TaxID=85085 RepID=UPI0005F2BB77|nr:siderophore-interacting protein [Pseudarthrobacter chlorophenolicus]
MKTRDAAATTPLNTKPLNTEPMTLAFEVTVSSVQELSPNFRRITFGGYCLRDFGVHGDTLDLRIKLMIPSVAADGSQIPLPVFEMGESGWYREWLAMDPAVKGSMRTYTVRDARLDEVYSEIDVDFVMHFDDHGNGGPAANWALNAKPGDAITIIGPNNRAAHCVTAEIYSGIEWRPGLAQRVLLAGDETAIPAISAILESLPSYMTGHAFLEVPEAGDFQQLSSPADIEITWLARGAAIGRSRPHGQLLQDAVRKAVPVPGWVGIKASDAGAGPEPEDVNVDEDILWETPSRMETAAISATKNPDMPAGAMPFYAWIAGEAAVIKDMRRYLVRDVGMDRKQVAFMGYWRQGKAEG